MSGVITVGVDGSEHGKAAADWAAAEAERRGMELRLVHAWVWQPLDLPVTADTEVQQRWAETLLREARARVTARSPGVPVTARLLPADPVPALVAEATEADMLVLGSRGHGALIGYLIGSIALHVLRQARGPVVLVRSQGGPDGDRGEPVAGPGEAVAAPVSDADEVVVGVPGAEEEAGAVLEFAFAAAAARGASLRAVRAWSIPPVFAWSPASMRLADEAGGLEPLERKRLADALQPWRERHPQVPVVEHVELGSAAQVLLSACGRAALLVVGRHASGPHVPQRIGHVAHAALHHAPCPVAVVPQP
ncbi:universal stress protein [Streptomyces telluris]|uniref:Universal stress protein n=1 Tax=Streptomyces telluris TaxID=2720021 RepID=A0A9X2LIB4_9ACTN|nr:universal stress protein [Streptomyces telluris]MCQ8771693.1 universal stress protein [Streptomyces telluris]NJP76189.1 universal stress protein [Streptomyces telluris]